MNILVAKPVPGKTRRDTVSLVFSLEVNRRVYDYTDYGEPPQLAIWLEKKEKTKTAKGEIRTVFVSYRTGKGIWKGKVDCPVSLPYWESRRLIEVHTSSAPSTTQPAAIPVPDALTGATPKRQLMVRTAIPTASEWYYYIEVNCSGDFNPNFPSWLKGGFPDPQENGQPSLVYRGLITGVPGAHSKPAILGRTDQLDPVDKVIPDVTGITSASELLFNISVSISQLSNPGSQES